MIQNILCVLYISIIIQKEREGIYFSVWDFGGLEDSPIMVDLDETETEMLYSYALEKIKLKANILKG